MRFKRYRTLCPGIAGALLVASCSASGKDVTVVKASEQMSRDGVELSHKPMLADVKVTETATENDASVCTQGRVLRRYKIEARSTDDVATSVDMASGHMIDALNSLGYELDRSTIIGARNDQYVAVAHKKKAKPISVIFIIQKYTPNIIISMSTSCLPEGKN